MNRPLVAVIDYDIGNIRSMSNALCAINVSPTITRDNGAIAAADILILPGVGAYSQGMANLRRYGLIDAVQRHVAQNKPFLGVCLGMQMLMDESEEFGSFEGLGFVEGKVKRLPIDPASRDKLPHVGWNNVMEPTPGRWTGGPFSSISGPSDVYFVHSFAAQPANEKHVLSITNYGGRTFCSAVQKGNVFGCQFHPEKSGPVGLGILKNFIAAACGGR